MAYENFKDSKVLFLQGTQTNLNNLISAGGAKEGAFYLTNDTHRLYVGRNNGTKVIPIAVNEGVVTVAAVANLPSTGVNAGEFYYATQENILCVYNGQQFIQINQDRDTTNASMTAAVAAAGNGAKITYTVTDTNGKPVTANFTIQDSTGNNVISIDGNVIDVKGDSYKLSTSHANNNLTIKLDSTNTTNDTSITLKGGSNVTIAADGTISSSYVNTKNASAGLVLNENGTMTVTVTDTDGKPVTATSDAITYLVNGTTVLPGNELPVYSEAEIDAKLRGLNGMTYQGTITSIPTGDIARGDTYMVTGDGEVTVAASDSYDGIAFTAKKGDLLIATGEEDASTGYIAAVKWSFVPSGNDEERDTTYTFTANKDNHKLSVTNDYNSNPAGSIQLVAGNDINLSSTASAGALTTTIKHANVTNTTSSGEEKSGALSFDAVTGVTVNAQGHVTNVETTKIGILDTTYTLEEPTVTTVTNGVKVTTLLQSSGNPSDSNLTVTSETLALKAGTHAYSVDIMWGEF